MQLALGRLSSAMHSAICPALCLWDRIACDPEFGDEAVCADDVEEICRPEGLRKHQDDLHICEGVLSRASRAAVGCGDKPDACATAARRAVICTTFSRSCMPRVLLQHAGNVQRTL